MHRLSIRPAIESDAEHFLALWDALDTETEFMLFEPNERQATLETQKKRLANAHLSQQVHILVLHDEEEKQLFGFCAGRRDQTLRDKHVLHIVIGLRQAVTNQNWGQALLTQLEHWAKLNGISRLELSVMVNNPLAIALYKKMGFNIEGTRIQAVRVKSGYVDEYMMGKLV